MCKISVVKAGFNLQELIEFIYFLLLFRTFSKLMLKCGGNKTCEHRELSKRAYLTLSLALLVVT